MERIAMSNLRDCARRVLSADKGLGMSAGVTTATGMATRRGLCSLRTSHSLVWGSRSRSLRELPLPARAIGVNSSRQIHTKPKPTQCRSYSTTPPPTPDHLNDNEAAIYTMLMRELQPTRLDVRDISGGCGSMYGIEVESERFRGLGMLKQQRMVNQVLKEKMEKEGWHGVQLRTAVPAEK